MIRYIPAPKHALTGIVSIQDIISSLVTPQRTADSRFVAPTPIIAPAMV